MRKVVRPLAGFAVVAVAALGLSGCADGVELNGKIFDAMGVGSNSQKAEREARVEPRSPLVPPPRTDKLPVPGEENNAHMAWPTDPDTKKKQAALDAQKKRQQDCANEKKFGTAADDKQGNNDPKRDCGSILNLFWGSNANEPNRPTEEESKKMSR